VLSLPSDDDGVSRLDGGDFLNLAITLSNFCINKSISDFLTPIEAPAVIYGQG